MERDATTASEPTAATGVAVSEFRQAEQRFLAACKLEATERWLTLERPRMRARVLEAGDGPPVLHVHGGGAFGALDAPLAAVMPGRRHILLDRPGFGLSDRVDLGPDFRAHSVEFLRSVVDALGVDRIDIVANSIGAGMSLWFALAHPDRVRSLGLVGAAAMMRATGPAPFALRLLATPIGSLLMSLEKPSPAQVRRFFARFGHPAETLDPTLHDLMLAVERLPTYQRAWRELLKATLSFSGQHPYLEITDDELRTLECPVAFAWGANDPMIAAERGRVAAALIPNAQFTIAGNGHAPWLDDAAAVARAIEPVLAPTATA